MNITVYLASSEGKDPALKEAERAFGTWKRPGSSLSSSSMLSCSMRGSRGSSPPKT